MMLDHETKNKMKNADAPINPVRGADNVPFKCQDLQDWGHRVPVAIGLTKREYFAAMAMQGLLANPNLGQTYDMSEVASMAYNRADELLIELG